MMLVSHIVDTDPAKALDAVIYLMDPVDPSSNVPKALALNASAHRRLPLVIENPVTSLDAETFAPPR